MYRLRYQRTPTYSDEPFFGLRSLYCIVRDEVHVIPLLFVYWLLVSRLSWHAQLYRYHFMDTSTVSACYTL